MEVEPDQEAEIVVADPQGASYTVVGPTQLFVEASAIKGGVIRICQVAKGKPHRWYTWQVGPRPVPDPVSLPTAKLTASPTRLDAKAPAPVHLEWTTAPEGAKVTLNDGNGPKDVDPNGSAVVLPRITTLYTIAATTIDGSVAYSQAIVTVSEDPPPPVVDTKALVSIVYESSEMPVPRQVHNARFELEQKGFEVRVVDADVVTGLGTIPAHMKAAIEAARSHGLPCLVITSGDKVIRKVALPATDAEIVKAVTQ